MTPARLCNAPRGLLQIHPKIMDSFTLRKRYLDAVDPAGRCAIAYCTELRWGPLALCWDAVSLHEPGRPAVHRSTWHTPDGAGAPPDERAMASWRSEKLGCRVACQAWYPPFASRLLQSEAGTLDWSCDAPGAAVSFEFDDRPSVEGEGYAEHVVLAMPPWTLPLRELRWGRWLSGAPRHSIVWVEWRGERPLTLVVEDGALQGGAVSDESIRCGDTTLELTGTETLYSRTLADVLGGAGRVVNRLPASWRALEDRKTLSRGILGDQSGWAIHEMVRFP
jgi:hypothetical protein